MAGFAGHKVTKKEKKEFIGLAVLKRSRVLSLTTNATGEFPLFLHIWTTILIASI
jgi:hypothetical protein